MPNLINFYYIKFSSQFNIFLSFSGYGIVTVGLSRPILLFCQWRTADNTSPYNIRVRVCHLSSIKSLKNLRSLIFARDLKKQAWTGYGYDKKFSFGHYSPYYYNTILRKKCVKRYFYYMYQDVFNQLCDWKYILQTKNLLL